MQNFDLYSRYPVPSLYKESGTITLVDILKGPCAKPCINLVWFPLLFWLLLVSQWLLIISPSSSTLIPKYPYLHMYHINPYLPYVFLTLNICRQWKTLNPKPLNICRQWKRHVTHAIADQALVCTSTPVHPGFRI